MDLLGAVARADEGELGAIGGEGGLEFIGRMVGEMGGGAAGDWHAPEVATPGESEGLAVGREGGVECHLDGFGEGRWGENGQGDK